MTILQNAYRQILNYWPEFARIKQSKGQPDDILKVIRCEQGQDSILWPRGITPADCIHRDEIMKDPNVTKLYYSDTILGKFKYLAFIQLGIQYLKEHAEFEGSAIGEQVLNQKIAEEKKKLNGNEPRSIP